MSTPKRYLKPEVYQALAPQYVSGLLRGKARARFVFLMQQHPEIKAAVTAWEQQLDGLNERLEAVAPSPLLLNNIQTRIDPGLNVKAHQSSYSSESLSGKLKSWFANWWLGAGGLVATVMLASVLFWQTTQTPALINYVAVLENTAGTAQWVATSSKETRKLKLDRLGEALQQQDSLVLWAISKEDGSYYKFAEIQSQEQRWIALNEEAWQKIKSAESLIVTLEADINITEPKGPVLAKGLCVQLNYQTKKSV